MNTNETLLRTLAKGLAHQLTTVRQPAQLSADDLYALLTRAAAQPERTSLLSNDGQFDFSKSGQPLSGATLTRMLGTRDLVPGTCSPAVVRRKLGTLDVDFAGETDMDWDGQFSQTSTDGERIWADDENCSVPEGQLVIVPSKILRSEREFATAITDPTSTLLPVREPLLAAYREWLSGHRAGAQARRHVGKEQLQAAADALGFSLTARERAALLNGLARN